MCKQPYHQLRSSEAQIYKQFKPDFFDLIIVDECHRSSARDDSNWHEILTYFNSATQIGMTATPKETNDVSNINYFGEPIYTYSYRQAVYEGYLCDHDVPYVLSTTKTREGIHFSEGQIVPKYDPNTKEIINEAVLPDELGAL